MSGASLFVVGAMFGMVVALLFWALLSDLNNRKPHNRKSDYRWPKDGAR